MPDFGPRTDAVIVNDAIIATLHTYTQTAGVTRLIQAFLLASTVTAGIAVTSGTLRFVTVGTWKGAVLAVQPEAHLLLYGSGPTSLSGAIVGDGGGAVRFASGIFSVDLAGAVFGFAPNML